jgi:hypothetical protein
MSDKWMYEFSVPKTETIKKVVETTDDKGEKKETTTEEIKKFKVGFAIKKPTRRVYDDANLYYAVKISEGVKAGMMTRALLEKRYENDGGELSESESDEIATLTYRLYQCQGELEKVTLNLDKIPEEDKNKKTESVIEEITKIRTELIRFENLRNSFYEQTAEARAQRLSAIWWVVQLSHMKEDKDANYVNLFLGDTYEEKLSHFDQMDEGDDVFWSANTARLAYLVSAWNSGQASVKEEFEEIDKIFAELNESENLEEKPKKEEEPKEEPKKEPKEGPKEEPKKKPKEKKTPTPSKDEPKG